MKVMIAIDSFKGSLSSANASQAISSGIKDVYPDAEISCLPLADGGEGTVDALVQATNGQRVALEVTGPLQERTAAIYGILGDGETAIIEVAAACGLPLVPPAKRNPLLTTTYGVGELISDAIDKGCRKFVIGLGGSATSDAGVGMLQALGFRFLDENGEDVGQGGQMLAQIRRIETSGAKPELKSCTFQAACDVNNPLYGTNGAAHIFGPQKGATSDMVRKLDEGLVRFAQTVAGELGKDINDMPGAGAAGGLGAAFAGFLDGRLQSGIGLVLEVIGLEDKLKGADFVITGEGKLDEQTAMGKAPSGVARLAQKHGIPVIALAGGVPTETAALNAAGITACFSIVNQPMSLEQAMDHECASANLRGITSQLFHLIRAVKS